jgi:hypothetical protein
LGFILVAAMLGLAATAEGNAESWAIRGQMTHMTAERFLTESSDKMDVCNRTKRA